MLVCVSGNISIADVRFGESIVRPTNIYVSECIGKADIVPVTLSVMVVPLSMKVSVMSANVSENIVKYQISANKRISVRPVDLCQ